MGFKVENKVDLSKYKNRLSVGMELELNKLLNTALEEISTAAGSGRGIDGKPFRQYSPAYQRARAKRGYTVSPPNLTITGRMLGSMKVGIQRTAGKLLGKIEISGASASGIGKRKTSSHADRAEWVGEDRPFFGFWTFRKKFILQALERYLKTGK